MSVVKLDYSGEVAIETYLTYSDMVFQILKTVLMVRYVTPEMGAPGTCIPI